MWQKTGSRTVMPAVAGVAMAHLSYSGVAVIQGVGFLLVGLVEIMLIRWIYSLDTGLAGIGQVSDMVQRKESLTAKLVHIASGFKFFFHHKLCLAGISLAMLYLTVLGFDGITIRFNLITYKLSKFTLLTSDHLSLLPIFCLNLFGLKTKL